MLVTIVMLLAGLALLYAGAEWMVRGAANIAMILGVKPVMVGLTVVAFGTSAPELVTCLIAVFRGSNDIALGNVIGSNIANIGLVMAMAALISPIVLGAGDSQNEIPFMIGFTALFLLFMLDGTVSRPDGVILLALLLGFTAYCVISARRYKTDVMEMEGKVETIKDVEHSLAFELGITAAGIVGVMAGAYLLIDSAAAIARALGISELVIGITIVAVGTSLPELATSVVAAVRGHSGLVFGAIVGSNIFNIGLILGLTAMAVPLDAPLENLYMEAGALAVFSVALVPMMWRRRLGRISGGALLTGYVAFIAWIAFMKAAG